MVTVKQVEKNSIASKAGFIDGDVIISVNGDEINDVLDYRYYTTERKMTVSVCRNGENIDIRVSKKDE